MDLLRTGIAWLAAFGTAMVFGCAADAVAEPAPPKKVGVIIALTGPLAPVGESIRRAVTIASEELDPERTVTFVFEDDQFQAKTAVAAAEKLLQQDKVDALITFSGATSAAVSIIAERRKVPMIGITALSTIGVSKSFVHTLFMATAQQVDLLSKSVADSGFKRVAVVTTTHDSMLQFRSMFTERNRSLIVRDDEVTPGDTNLGITVTRITAEKPDAVVLFTLPPQISIVGRLLREQGFTGQVLGGPPLFNPPEILASRGGLVGAWVPGPAGGELDAFLSAYRKRFGEPCISEGVYGHEAAGMMIAAARSGDIAKYILEAKSYPGIAGVYPRRSDNLFEVPASMKEISADGELVARATAK